MICVHKIQRRRNKMKTWKTPEIIEIDEKMIEEYINVNARTGGCFGFDNCGGVRHN